MNACGLPIIAATNRHVFVRSVWTHLYHFLQCLVVTGGMGRLVCSLFPQYTSFCIIEVYAETLSDFDTSLEWCVGAFKSTRLVVRFHDASNSKMI